MEKIPYSIFSL
jgi:hypothetical protein